MTLEELRELQSMTQQELADRARVAVGTISRIERGFPTNRNTIARIADALGVRSNEITGVTLNRNRYKPAKRNARRG